MNTRENILRQIRNGQQMVVGQGGRAIRPAGEPVANGTVVKPHKWGV